VLGEGGGVVWGRCRGETVVLPGNRAGGVCRTAETAGSGGGKRKTNPTRSKNEGWGVFACGASGITETVGGGLVCGWVGGG